MEENYDDTHFDSELRAQIDGFWTESRLVQTSTMRNAKVLLAKESSEERRAKSNKKQCGVWFVVVLSVKAKMARRRDKAEQKCESTERLTVWGVRRRWEQKKWVPWALSLFSVFREAVKVHRTLVVHKECIVVGRKAKNLFLLLWSRSQALWQSRKTWLRDKMNTPTTALQLMWLCSLGG